MKKFLLVFCLLFAVGCSDDKASIAKKMVQDIVYVYDEKTGLCYACSFGKAANSAENFTNYDGAVMTIVPYDAVKDYLINPPAAVPPQPITPKSPYPFSIEPE